MQRPALSISVRLLALPLMLGLLLLTGCQTNRDDRDEARGGPTLVYERARDALDRQDFDNAIRIYEALVARYPFAPEARQARLDLIYAYYKGRETDSAIDQAARAVQDLLPQARLPAWHPQPGPAWPPAG